ncbi:polysaccharide deacetylase family protein [Rhodocaloribacter litoris]|uniref:polysaccharide deacetylase family protein n=1 Tax=Rhodocaloribacter litoris TaxID=2558931 RepID=UPI00141D9ECF|nr:polysaccharide deacetylase family protein [Rhodocaloribacter litoris]QXD16201.1 polysaccharide deacetylase family protein [Rhodocaloribacter litoris]
MDFTFVDQFRHELDSLLRGYPDFVYARKPEPLRGYVPVFVYHTVDPHAFEADLQFLGENGYSTVGMEELVAFLEGRQVLPDKHVVLTFDDARSSFWRYGFPLLQRYQMKGVLFVIAGLTLDAPDVRSNLRDVWEGRATLSDIERLDAEDTTLCTWPELREMYRSGWVEIESHSLFHREVFCDTRVMGILGPESSYVPYQTSVTAYLGLDDVGRGIQPSRYYGLPLFRTTSLFRGTSFWKLDIERLAARSPVHPGDDLRAIMRYQDLTATERCIERDVIRARELLQSRVDQRAGRHFCLPYTLGSALSTRVLRRLEVPSCVWGIIPGQVYNAPGIDPLRICRLKADFIWRLPGVGRRSLTQVYRGKLRRRLEGGRVY